MLKNRYFLHRLKRSGIDSTFKELQKSLLSDYKSKPDEIRGGPFLAFKENTDFRVIEKLVKEQISKTQEKSLEKSESIEKRMEGETLKSSLSEFKPPNQTKSALL